MSLEEILAKRRASDQQKHEDDSKKRLLSVVRKKAQTSFIGALATFETLFGKLWGHGLSDSQLTQSQREWRSRWNEARNSILTNGNQQLRAVEAELVTYRVTWDRHQMTLRSTNETPKEDRNGE